MLESTFNNVEGLQACIFIRIRLQQRCFPVNIAKFLRAHILKYICERLLLYSEIYTSNNQIYILAENFILGFTKYFIICSALPTLAPLNYVFLLHFSHFFLLHIIFNIFYESSNVSLFSSLNKLNAFVHYQKFVIIRNAQTLISGFIQGQR